MHAKIKSFDEIKALLRVKITERNYRERMLYFKGCLEVTRIHNSDGELDDTLANFLGRHAQMIGFKSNIIGQLIGEYL
jgi:hypothetical protein